MYVKFGKFTCYFGAFIVRFEPSRCRGWIGAVEKQPVEVSRGLGDIWEPFFGHVNFWTFSLKSKAPTLTMPH